MDRKNEKDDVAKRLKNDCLNLYAPFGPPPDSVRVRFHCFSIEVSKTIIKFGIHVGSPVLYRNNLKNLFLTASAFSQNSHLRSRL